MGEIYSTCTVVELAPNAGYKEVIIVTPDTADTGDTIDVTLTDIGISKTGFLSIVGAVQTTAASVVVAEAPTTSVTTGTLTITIGGSTVSDKIRIYRILGKSA